jgi:hypothetical protein
VANGRDHLLERRPGQALPVPGAGAASHEGDLIYLPLDMRRAVMTPPFFMNMRCTCMYILCFLSLASHLSFLAAFFHSTYLNTGANSKAEK